MTASVAPGGAAKGLRIRAFDWLRGGAVLVMIQTHALPLLRPELRTGTWYGRLDFVDGLVAPSFIFAAGFSLALVQIRGVSQGARAMRVRKTLRRLMEVLLIGTLLNWMWFPVRQEPRWLLRIDILQCIGLALLLALPILAWLAKSPRLLCWVALALALGAFFAAPVGEGVKPPWAALFNISTGSLFPLLPWSGYVYLGASTGAVAATGDNQSLRRWLFGLAILGAVLSQTQAPLAALYKNHLWIDDPANHGQRWALVSVLALLLLWLEARARQPQTRSSAVRFVEAFGTSSLAAYFFHETLMYYETFGFSFHRFWGGRCGWPAYWLLTAALIGATFVLVLITDWLYQRAARPFQKFRGDGTRLTVLS